MHLYMRNYFQSNLSILRTQIDIPLSTIFCPDFLSSVSDTARPSKRKKRCRIMKIYQNILIQKENKQKKTKHVT